MRVLIVEDDPSQRQLLRRVVEEVATVVEAANADEAIAAPGTFDLVLCDYTLPDHKTARDVAKARPEPLIVLSGYDRPDDWHGTWYRKPVTVTELRTIVAQFKERR